MRFVITGADYAPNDFDKQLPLKITLIRKLPGEDRPDYWLAKTNKSIKWTDEDREIKYVIVAPRYVGSSITRQVKEIILGMAYVIDESILKDLKLDFKKCKYIAICVAKRTYL